MQLLIGGATSFPLASFHSTLYKIGNATSSMFIVMMFSPLQQ